MSEHTPGPWESCQRGAMNQLTVSDDQGYVIARITEREGDHANQCLIKAAPRMLKALEGAAKRLEQVFADGNADYQEVVSAIAEARGE